MSAVENHKREILLPRYDPLFHLLSNVRNDNYAVYKRHMLLDKREKNIHIHIYGADVNNCVTEFDIRAVETFGRHHCNGTVNIVYEKGHLHLIGTECKLSEKSVIAQIESYIIEQLIEYKQVLPEKYNSVLKDFVIIISKKPMHQHIPNIPHTNDVALPDIFWEKLQHGNTI